MRFHSLIWTYCILSLLMGCNQSLNKLPISENTLAYDLVLDLKKDSLGFNKEESLVGKVYIAPYENNKMFKIKIQLQRSLNTAGYQLFVNGDSNYKLMDYNTSYFFVGDAKDPNNIKVRLKLNQNQFISANLRSLKNINHSGKLNMAGPALLSK